MWIGATEAVPQAVSETTLLVSVDEKRCGPLSGKEQSHPSSIKKILDKSCHYFRVVSSAERSGSADVA